MPVKSQTERKKGVREKKKEGAKRDTCTDTERQRGSERERERERVKERRRDMGREGGNEKEKEERTWCPPEKQPSLLLSPFLPPAFAGSMERHFYSGMRIRLPWTAARAPASARLLMGPEQCGATGGSTRGEEGCLCGGLSALHLGQAG